MPIRVLTFTETVAGATYTATTSVPAGARILDMLIETTAGWTAATAALDVGDSDAADALAAAVDVSSPFGVSAANQNGTDWGNGHNSVNGPLSAQGPGKLYPAGDTITAVITATVPGGPTGISRVSLWFVRRNAARAATVV